MTVNYKNSAGTDLDSLFSNTSSNAGSIGFLTSGGQDLGNRYYNGSLGYSVGYKNSAGTDLGYLRGKEPEYNATMRVGTDRYGKCGYFCSDWDDEWKGSLSPMYFNGIGIGSLSEYNGRIYITSGDFMRSPRTVTIKNIENGKSASVYCAWQNNNGSGSLGLSSYVGKKVRLMITMS